MRAILASLITLVILVGIAFALSPFTPHPIFGMLIAFLIIRSAALQYSLNRLKRTVELRELSHSLLVERVERVEFASSCSNVVWYRVVNGIAVNPEASSR